MKKYKLKDLVSNGSHSSREVRSNVLVGDIENGYGYGDILDANATQEVAKSVVDEKINIAKQEIAAMIELAGSGSSQDFSFILAQLEGLRDKNILQDEKDEEILQQIQNLMNSIHSNTPSVGGDNDNLIFS